MMAWVGNWCQAGRKWSRTLDPRPCTAVSSLDLVFTTVNLPALHYTTVDWALLIWLSGGVIGKVPRYECMYCTVQETESVCLGQVETECVSSGEVRLGKQCEI